MKIGILGVCQGVVSEKLHSILVLDTTKMRAENGGQQTPWSEVGKSGSENRRGLSWLVESSSARRLSFTEMISGCDFEETSSFRCSPTRAYSPLFSLVLV
jgi:hypothetical protein